MSEPKIKRDRASERACDGETVLQEINVCVICMRRISLNEDNVWMFELNLVQDVD